MNKQLLFLFTVFLYGMLSYGQTFTSNGINYTVTDAVAETVEVAVNAGYTGDAVIPATVTDSGITYQVTGIGLFAFKDCIGLTSMSLPGSIESIGIRAFLGCTGIESINIPDSVEVIRTSTFEDCTSLTSISIPNSVTSMETDAFRNCTALTSINIPSSVKTIGDHVFLNCVALESVHIPDSVESIGGFAFSGSGLKSINIPNSVTNLYFFTFRDCTNLTTVTIPDSIERIWQFVFLGCTSLESVNIPDSVTRIDNNAFDGCSALTSVTVGHVSPLSIDSSVFANVNAAGITLNVPMGSVSAYSTADIWEDFGTIRESGALDVEDSKVNKDVFGMYPVPNKGDLNIKSTVYDTFQIINQYGQEVKRFTVTPGTVSKINTGLLSDGVYYVKTARGTVTKKLVVKR